MRRRGPGIDKLAFHQEFYSFIYLFTLELPTKKNSSYPQKEEGESCHIQFRVSVNPEPCKQVRAVESDFRCNSDVDATRVFPPVYLEDGEHMAAAVADDAADKVCADRRADDSVLTTGTRHITGKQGTGYLFIYPELHA